jgi:hypothetical protein
VAPSPDGPGARIDGAALAGNAGSTPEADRPRPPESIPLAVLAAAALSAVLVGLSRQLKGDGVSW